MNPRLPLMLLGLAALPACAGTPHELPVAPTSADRHKIEVSQTTERLEISADNEFTDLNYEETAQLTEFARAYIRAGHGAVVLSTPSGADNAQIASQRAHKARMVLVDAGVPFGALAGSTYDASGSPAPPIVLSFTRFEAQAPECAPLWSQDLAHQSNNQPWESFGCASQANLAAMLEDPSDLLGPRDEEPRDSARRGVVFGAYRAGQPTHAKRDNDERVSISTAVE